MLRNIRVVFTPRQSKNLMSVNTTAENIILRALGQRRCENKPGQSKE